MILRKENRVSYTVIDNGLLNDPKLSFKAKGILCYLLSKPDGWRVRVKDLENHSGEGVTSIRSGLSELYKQGYAKIEYIKDERGRLQGSEVRVSEEPRFRKPETR